MIAGISHLTFVVADLERASLFFRTVFDAREVYSSGEKTFSLSKEKFFLIGGIWICAMEGRPPAERSYNHTAFQVEEERLDDCVEKIRRIGAEIKPERPRVAGEGRSVYFYDFDDHLFELHTGTLEERLARYAAD